MDKNYFDNHIHKSSDLANQEEMKILIAQQGAVLGTRKLNKDVMKFDQFTRYYDKDPNDKLYNIKRAYEIYKSNPTKFEDPEIGIASKESDGWHFSTVDPSTGIFLKHKNHPTINKELQWYNSPEGKSFKERFELDSLNDYFRYVPKRKQGGILYAQQGTKFKRLTFNNDEKELLNTKAVQDNTRNTPVPTMSNKEAAMHTDRQKRQIASNIKTGRNVAKKNPLKGTVKEWVDDFGNINLGDRMRLFPNDPNSKIDNYLNPLKMFGDMADGLGQSVANRSVSDFAKASIAPLTAGALAGLSGNFTSNLLNPVAGLKDVAKNTLKNTYKINPFANKLNNPANSYRPFKSEINWGNWNKEILDNPNLLKEYSQIEQSAKANNTWMKNSDGTSFTGTPEQFVQVNSSNFKKAFPSGYEKTFRGSTKYQPDPNAGHLKGRDGAVFTGDKHMADFYTSSAGKERFFGAEPSPSGVWELARKKSDDTVTVDVNRSEWSDLQLEPVAIQDLENRISTGSNTIKRHIKNGMAPDNTVIKTIESNIEQARNNLKTFDPAVDAKGKDYLRKYFNNGSFSTDDVASHVNESNIPGVKINSVLDGPLGNITIHNNKKGNYLKSLRGNNGMFDMTNPNLLKGITLPVIGGLAGLKNKD